MPEEKKRKNSPGAVTKSKLKNQSMGRTRIKNAKRRDRKEFKQGPVRDEKEFRDELAREKVGVRDEASVEC